MSTPLTGATQRARLELSGHRVRALPPMQDVDLIDDAIEVAALAPRSRFAQALHATEAMAC